MKQETQFLASKGIRVVRFWNSDVAENFDGVLETFLEEIVVRRRELTPTRRAAPHADLPNSGGGK